MSTIGILLSGGSSQRMGFNKLTASLGGRNALERSAALLVTSGCDRLVIALSDDTRPAAEALALPVPMTLCEGGSTRGGSVLNALRAADGQPGDIAVIHDAARCFQTVGAVRAAIESAKVNGSGVSSLPMTDSVFETDSQRPLDRSNLVRTQTPQAFRFEEILAAYQQAGDQNATDDAALYARYIGPVTFTPGSELRDLHPRQRAGSEADHPGGLGLGQGHGLPAPYRHGLRHPRAGRGPQAHPGRGGHPL